MEWVQGKELTEFIESQNEIKKQIDDYIIKFNEISFNISYEEISKEGLCKIKAAFEGKPIEYLQEKIINLHKQINKDRIIIKNQSEELHKLNLKLKKCIDIEAHNIATQKLRDIIVSLRDDVINKVDNMRDTKNKEIEKLKAVIEYLESKAK